MTNLVSVVGLERIQPKQLLVDPITKHAFIMLLDYGAKNADNLDSILKTSVTLKMMPVGLKVAKPLPRTLTINTSLVIDPVTKHGQIDLNGFDPARFTNCDIYEINVIISKRGQVKTAVQ